MKIDLVDCNAIIDYNLASPAARRRP